MDAKKSAEGTAEDGQNVVTQPPTADEHAQTGALPTHGHGRVMPSHQVQQPHMVPFVGATLDPRYKTQFCRNLSQKGFCQFGDLCLFAHHEAELRPPPPCRYGEECSRQDCMFSHPVQVPMGSHYQQYFPDAPFVDPHQQPGWYPFDFGYAAHPDDGLWVPQGPPGAAAGHVGQQQQQQQQQQQGPPSDSAAAQLLQAGQWPDPARAVRGDQQPPGQVASQQQIHQEQPQLQPHGEHVAVGGSEVTGPSLLVAPGGAPIAVSNGPIDTTFTFGQVAAALPPMTGGDNAVDVDNSSNRSAQNQEQNQSSQAGSQPQPGAPSSANQNQKKNAQSPGDVQSRNTQQQHSHTQQEAQAQQQAPKKAWTGNTAAVVTGAPKQAPAPAPQKVQPKSLPHTDGGNSGGGRRDSNSSDKTPGGQGQGRSGGGRGRQRGHSGGNDDSNAGAGGGGRGRNSRNRRKGKGDAGGHS